MVDAEDLSFLGRTQLGVSAGSPYVYIDEAQQ